jgi:hypothetical protein
MKRTQDDTKTPPTSARGLVGRAMTAEATTEETTMKLVIVIYPPETAYDTFPDGRRVENRRRSGPATKPKRK